MSVRRPRFSGFHPDNDPCHYVLEASNTKTPAAQALGDARIPAPHYVRLKDGRKVAQWSKTEQSRVAGFRPEKDCNGNFMSYLYQPNNNCYNYACNIATNSFAIPGRKRLVRLIPAHKSISAAGVIAAAKADGLIEIGRDPMKLAEALRILANERRRGRLQDGHLVALLISKADSKIHWKGDFHFVRCDSISGRSWSQKDGPDQVTDFDFAGKKISNPSISNWTVNQGPRRHRRHLPHSLIFAQQTTYSFAAWLFVQFGKVSII